MSAPNAPTIIMAGGSAPQPTSLLEKGAKIAGIGIACLIIGIIAYVVYKKFFYKPPTPTATVNMDRITTERDYSETIRNEELQTSASIEDAHASVDIAQEIVTQNAIITVNEQLAIAQQLDIADIALQISAIENKEDIIVGKMVLYNKTFDHYVFLRTHEPQWYYEQKMKDAFWKAVATDEAICKSYEDEIATLKTAIEKNYDALAPSIEHAKLAFGRTLLNTFVSIGNADGTEPLGKWTEGTQEVQPATA